MSNQSNQLIAIEALLEALNNADFYKDYVVRGSYISRQWMGDHSRICQDLDLLYLKDYQADIVVKHFTQLIHNTRDVSFDENTLVYEPIWEGTISPGVRFTVDYQLANQQSNLQIDIGCNDPLVIPPIEQTITSTNHAFNLRIVPLEILAAWKLHGLFEHLNGPWQSKTLWDLYLFCRFNTLDKNLFIKASEKAFSSRLDPIEIINRLLFGDFANSKKSKRYWAIDFPAFCSDDFIPLEDVLTWLKD